MFLSNTNPPFLLPLCYFACSEISKGFTSTSPASPRLTEPATLHFISHSHTKTIIISWLTRINQCRNLPFASHSMSSVLLVLSLPLIDPHPRFRDTAILHFTSHSYHLLIQDIATLPFASHSKSSVLKYCHHHLLTQLKNKKGHNFTFCITLPSSS